MQSTLRAIDLTGLETGVLRRMQVDESRPVVVLSALSTLAPSPDAALLGIAQEAFRDAYHSYFRPARLDPETLDKIVALNPAVASARGLAGLSGAAAAVGGQHRRAEGSLRAACQRRPSFRQ